MMLERDVSERIGLLLGCAIALLIDGLRACNSAFLWC
jgi:hypothetical protein